MKFINEMFHVFVPKNFVFSGSYEILSQYLINSSRFDGPI